MASNRYNGYSGYNGYSSYNRSNKTNRQQLDTRPSTSRTRSRSSNSTTVVRTDKALYVGDKTATAIITFGTIFGTLPDPTFSSQMIGGIIATSGVGLKLCIWVCRKCKNKFQEWREERHMRKCRDEFCRRCI